MIQKIKISAILCVLLLVFTNRSEAQVQKMASYVFASDSVAGFDEVAASAEAFAHACYGFEYKVFMYKAKRDFVKQKYNIATAPTLPLTLFQNMGLQKGMSAGGTCNNEDFELAFGGGGITAPGTVQGWTLQSGTNANSCNPPNLTGVNYYTVYAGPVIDPKIPTPVSSYFDAGSNITPSGNCFIRLNDQSAGSKAVKLSKSFIVTPANALFEYAYLPVIENGGHQCCEQPGFNIHVTVTNTTSGQASVLACPQISIAVPSTLCNYTPAPTDPVFITALGPAGWAYHAWAASAIDLTPYIGNLVQLDVVVVDCNQGGHAAYAYFDAKCAPMTVLGNNNQFPAGSASFTLPTCGAQSATICAPDGLGPYSWAGPGVTAPYNTPLNTNQCFTVGVSADFTLTMNPPGSCQPINRVMTVTITPAPYILASVNQAACGSTLGVVSWTAAGSASVNPTIIWNPVPTSTTSSASNLGTATFTAGTGVVTVTALDPLGCKVSATVNIGPPPPALTVSIQNITGSQSITCITPSVDLQVLTNYTLNPINVFWSSNSFTSTSQSITVVNAATLITLTAIDPITGCQTTATTSIKVDTVTPVSSVSPVNQLINCGPGVVATATGVALSPTINVSHQWFGPDGLINPPTGGVVSIYNPIINGANGTSTFVLTNLINGCSTTKTVQVVSTAGGYPSFAVSSNLSANGYSLGCGTRSVTDVNIVNAQTYPTGGGAVSYTILPPGFTGTNYTTNTTAAYTVNVPGTYTLIVRDNVNQCENRVPLSVIQNTAGPVIIITASTRTLSCDIPTVSLEGSSTNQNVTYTWKDNGNPSSFPNGTITINTTTAGAAVPSGTVVDNYTLTVIDNTLLGNHCPSSTVVTMYQNTRPPKANIALSNPALTCIVYSVNLSNNSSTGILPGTFFATQNVVATLWEGPTPQEPLPNSSTYLGYTAGVYTMTVKDLNNGCTSQTTTTVGDNRIYPVIVTNTQVALDCGASSTGGVKLSAVALGLSPALITSQWTVPNNPTPNIQNPNTLTLTTDGVGEYQLSVTTNSNGCGSKVEVVVTNGVLNAGFNVDQQSGFAPLTVNFTNSSASSSTVSGTSSITTVWSFGNGTTKTTTVNTTNANAATTAVYTQPGTYTVTMFAAKGSCFDSVSKVIHVDIPSKLEVPNVFTPNGDNSNDIFFVKTANLSEITALIYDRWGNKIYELTTEKGNIAWDGKTQAGKEAPDGTYFYVITATGKDGQSYNTKGTVSLYR